MTDYDPKVNQRIYHGPFEPLEYITEEDEEYYTGFAEIVREANHDLDPVYDILYAFTWSPDPNKYPTVKPRSQYKCLLRHCLLSAYKCFGKFVFVPELTNNGYVHIHGYYTIKDKVKLHKWFLPKCRQYGFVLIKSKQINKEWYDDYITKDIASTNQILGDDLPIPLTHKNHEAYKFLWNKHRNIKRFMTRLPKPRDITQMLK